MVESLTSFITRVAYSHGVPPSLIIRQEFPRFALDSVNGDGSRRFNGMGENALACARGFEQLTKRTQLVRLTMLPWKNVISMRDLLEEKLYWCAKCLRDQQDQGQNFYPLLWFLRYVRVCPLHEETLRDSCPNTKCNRKIPAFHHSARPHTCPFCQANLAGYEQDAICSSEGSKTNPLIMFSLWASSALGELLASPGPNEQNSNILLACIQATGRSWKSFSRELGFSFTSVRGWAKGVSVPSLAAILRLCYCLGLTPRQLLVDGVSSIGRLNINESRVAYLKSDMRLMPDRRRYSDSLLRKTLEDALVENPPPSLRDVLDRIGCSNRTIYSRFGDLAKTVSARHKEYRSKEGERRRARVASEAEMLTRKLWAEGVYPSRRRLDELAGWSITLDRVGREAWKGTLEELQAGPIQVSKNGRSNIIP